MYRKHFIFPLLICIFVTSLQCQTENQGRSRDQEEQNEVKTGAAHLVEDDFRLLDGKSVGIITNPSAVVGDQHLIDVLHEADNVDVAALFGPEHGLRGTAGTGETITGDGRDTVTGAPIYSLYYDETRQPTPEELEGLGALIYDLQDVGARFYTRLSIMGLAMQAAAEADLPFVVLDRPNPVGGQYVSGFTMASEHQSFVGKYPIPVAYGLTPGELARMIKGEGWLPGLEDLKLEVVEMQGWERAMRWPRTGLSWTRSSPNLPTFETALVYVGTCFFEATNKASEGRGTRRPFTHLGAPWADGQALADTLNTRGLPGTSFHPTAFTPRPIEGMASDPGMAGQKLRGIRIAVTDASAYRPVETGIHVLHAFYRQAWRQGRAEDFFTSYIEQLAGTDRLRKMLRRGARPEAIIAGWQDEVQAFRKRRQPYLLYD